MINKVDKKAKRLTRHKRIRAKITGTSEKPRLCVYRSLKNIYVQIIDDTKGVTLAAASSVEKEFGSKGGNRDDAMEIGKLIAQRAKEKGIEEVVFDRGGYLYHGRVENLAKGAREAGLKF